MTTEEAVNRLARSVLDLRGAVDQFRTGLELAEARATAAEAAVVALRTTVEDQTGLIRQLTNGSATAAQLIDGLGVRVTELAIAGEKAVAMVECDLSAAIERAETAVGGIANDVAESARATAALVSTLTSKLPKALVIDHAGDLIATLHNGDAVTVGPVRGPAGRDAPRVADVSISHGHLIHKMTDGTSFLAALPDLAPSPAADPAPPLAARTPAGDRVKDEIRMGIIMDRKSDSLAAIGKKYGVSARVVSRIIKEFKA